MDKYQIAKDIGHLPVFNNVSMQMNFLETLNKISTIRNGLTNNTLDFRETDFLLETSKDAAKSTSMPLTSNSLDITALLGDLRYQILHNDQCAFTDTLILLATTNYGELVSKKPEIVVDRDLSYSYSHMKGSLSEREIARHGKYLMSYQFCHRAIASGTQSYGYSRQYGNVKWEEFSLSSEILGDITEFVVSVPYNTSGILDKPLEYRWSYKYVRFHLSELQAEQASTVSEQFDYILKRLYFELAVALKNGKVPKGKVPIDANFSALDSYFSHYKVVERPFDRNVSAQSGREAALQLHAVTLMPDKDAKLYSVSENRKIVDTYINTLASSQFSLLIKELNQAIKEIERRMRCHHKFPQIYNRWMYNELLIKNLVHCSGLLYGLSDVHNLGFGKALIDIKGEPLKNANGTNVKSYPGNIPQYMDMVDRYLSGEIQFENFFDTIYAIRCNQETLLSKHFKAFAESFVEINGCRVPCFYLVGDGDGVRGIVRNKRQAYIALKRAAKYSLATISSGMGLTSIRPDDTEDELFCRAEFALHVTKLFKGIQNSWEELCVYGEVFDYTKAQCALSIVEKKVTLAENNPNRLDSYLAKMIGYQHLWIMHFPPQNRNDLSRLLSRASKFINSDNLH